MRSDWIIDVLADLKSYAEMNGLSATAASLEDAILVALAEGGSLRAHGRSGTGSVVQAGHDGETGNVTWLFAGSDNA